MDLLSAVEPRAINPALVTPGETPEEKTGNAKYVISVARKIGATGESPCAVSVLLRGRRGERAAGRHI